ncbi:hypothetical protein DFJ73DRAFT_570186 [Zopfochytrium polystomum]|nr:hypothetical protein DFJ73DRAFT_570186 [Zopfochytrium polystomum]
MRKVRRLNSFHPNLKRSTGQYFASLEKFAFEAGRFVPWGLVPPKTLALSRRYPPKNGLLRVLEVIISPSTFQSTTYVLELLFDMSTEDITFLKEDSTHDTLLRFYRIADKSQSPVVPSFISKTSINGCDVKYPEPFNEGTGWTQGVLPCKEHLVVGANVISFVVEEKDSVDTDIVVELDKVAFIKPQQAFHEAVSRASPYESVRKIIAARKSKGSTRHSLVCPMSQNRIKYAVRSTSCLHLRCFDLQTWLQRQLDRPNWTCPHCKSFVSCDKLFLDQYTQSILNEAPRDVCYFDVDDNGSWKPVPSVTSSSSVIDLTGEEASASVLSSDEQRHSQLGEIPSSSNSAKRGMSNEEDISTSKRQKPLESDVTASSSTTLRQEQAVVGASSSGVDQNSSKTPNIVTSSKTLFEGHSPEFRENGIQPTSADPGQSQENSSRSSDSLKSLPTSPKPTPLSRTPSVLTAMRNDEQPATRPVTATERIMQSETAAEPGRDRSPGSDASDTVVAANTAANQKKRKNKPLLTAPDLSRIISGWASAISVPEKTTETGNTERAPKSVPLNEEVQTDTLTFTRDTSDENHTANNSPPSIIPEPETVEPQSDNLSPSEREMAYLAELEGDPEWV